MFLKSNYPMISIFIEIWQINIFSMAAILKKNGWLEIKFNSAIMFAASNYP